METTCEVIERFTKLFDTVFNIKLVTDDNIGIQYVRPERIEMEDDGSITIVIKAWR